MLALDQARAAGLTYRQVRCRVDAGRWDELRPRVYRLRGAPPSWYAEVVAAVLAAGRGAAASHATAARLWDLTRVPTTALEVLVREPRRPRLEGVLVHRTRVLPPGDIRVIDGIPCTSPERTLVDLAPRLDDPLLLSVVDDALFGGIARRPRLHERSTALGNGRNGIDLLRRVAADDGEEAVRSWLERETARILVQAGLPPPLWNAPVHDDQGRIGLVDALWPTERLVLELDGLRFHSSDEQRRRDRARDRRLLLAGYRVLRYTWLDVRRRPEVLVREVRRALAGR